MLFCVFLSACGDVGSVEITSHFLYTLCVCRTCFIGIVSLFGRTLRVGPDGASVGKMYNEKMIKIWNEVFMSFRWKKRTAAFILTTTVVLALSACGSGGADETSTIAVSEPVTKASVTELTENVTETVSETEKGNMAELSDTGTDQTVVGSMDSDTEVAYREICFKLPKGWVGVAVPDENKCYYFYAANATCMLNRQDLNGADLTSDAGVRGVIEGIEEGGFKNVALAETFPAGDAKGFVFTGTVDSNGSTLYGTIIYVQVDDEIYTFLIATEDMETYESDIKTLKTSLCRKQK